MRKGGEDGDEQEASRAGFIAHTPCKDCSGQEAAGSIDHHGTAGAKV